jgi:hypothetical protein
MESRAMHNRLQVSFTVEGAIAIAAALLIVIAVDKSADRSSSEGSQFLNGEPCYAQSTSVQLLGTASSRRWQRDPRASAMKPRFTLTISVNVALCLFGIAAIIKALMH